MNNNKISVIVPIYNCEQYIRKCIKSILNQTFKEFELILIDDGTQDKSGEICDEFSKIDERIVVIHQHNQGVSKTRQNGLNMSKSKYVTFIDSDDYVKEDYLYNLYNHIINSNADFVCCNSIDIGENLPKNFRIMKDEIISDKARLLTDYFNGKRYAYCIWGKLFKKDIFKDIEFPEMKYAEDTCIILNLFMKCNNVAVMSYDGYYYVQREQSATFSGNNLQKANDVLIRSKLVNNICKKIDNKELLLKAKNEMTQSLYGAILANCCYADKEQFKQFKTQYEQLYKDCVNTNKIKFLIIKIFKLNKNLTRILFEFMYFFKEKNRRTYEERRNFNNK